MVSSANCFAFYCPDSLVITSLILLFHIRIEMAEQSPQTNKRVSKPKKIFSPQPTAVRTKKKNSQAAAAALVEPTVTFSKPNYSIAAFDVLHVLLFSS